MAKKAKSAIKKAQTEPYKHPEAKSLMRPEVGTQGQFKKKRSPKTYRYDSSLSPALDWDAKNPAREQGEQLIKQVLDAKSLEEAKAAVTKEYDPLEDGKRGAAERWVAAVNADGAYGQWQYGVAKKVSDVSDLLQ